MVLEIAMLTIALSSPPQKSSSREDHIFSFDSRVENDHVRECSRIRPEVLIADNLEAALAKDLASLYEVRHVLTERADDNLLVWIGIDNAESYRVRSQIYDKELALMDGFPEISFDFNLIPAMGRTARDLASGAKIIFSR